MLSDGRLADFSRFFLATCIDQIRFMQAMLSPEELSARLREFIALEALQDRLDPRVGAVLERATLFGEVARAHVPSLTGVSDRQARRLVKPLQDRGLLVGAKDEPLRIAFPLGESERIFPHLWAPASVAMPRAPDIAAALRGPTPSRSAGGE